MSWKLTNKFMGPCTACGNVPVDERENGKPALEMFVFEGLNINYGEDLNICQNCAGVLSDLLGRPDGERVREIEETLETERAGRVDAEEKLKKIKSKIEEVVNGNKAKKALKEEL